MKGHATVEMPNGATGNRPPRLHLANRRRWRVGIVGHRTTARRGTALGLLESSTRGTPAGGPTAADELIVDSARAAAQSELGHLARRAGRLARRRDRLTARAQGLRSEAAALLDERHTGPWGAAETAADQQRHHDELAEQVAASVRDGERQHRRVRLGHRFAARLLPWIDAVLFAYFISGVSNASLEAPWTTPVASLVALVFTALLVVTIAVFTPWLGRHLRHHKDVDGELDWPRLGPVATALVVGWAVLTAAIGVAMFVRVQVEAGYADADTVAGITVSTLLALAAVAMNGYVLVVAFSDGSPIADDLHARGRSLRRTARRHDRLLHRAARCDRRRELLTHAACRAEARALVRAEARLREGERTLDLVRLRTGVDARLPRPERWTAEQLDHRELVVAIHEPDLKVI